MTYSEIQREVKALIKDESPEIILAIPDLINEVYLETVENEDFPSQKTFASVSTVLAQAWANLSSTYSGKLTYVGNVDGKLNNVGTLEALIELYPTLSDVGDVIDVALEHSVLWYNPIPSTVSTLYLILYTACTEMSEDNDTPSILPSFIQREILVNGAASKAWSIIEAGNIDEKPNTVFYNGLAEVGRSKLRMWLGKRKSNVSRSIWDA
jgi:hypothetical protein